MELVEGPERVVTCRRAAELRDRLKPAHERAFARSECRPDTCRSARLSQGETHRPLRDLHPVLLEIFQHRRVDVAH
jgi:hypothetical protein